MHLLQTDISHESKKSHYSPPKTEKTPTGEVDVIYPPSPQLGGKASTRHR